MQKPLRWKAGAKVDGDYCSEGSGYIAPVVPERLYVDKVFHKTFVKVDEDSTVAAAATAVVMRRDASLPARSEEFIADHPFLFFLQDQRSGLALFMGRVERSR